MPCWRCQSVLSEAEHVQATAWGLCQPCRDELRGATLIAPLMVPESSAAPAPPEPEPAPEPRRAIAVYSEAGELLAMCAADVELGGVVGLARGAGASGRLLVEEVAATTADTTRGTSGQ